MVDVKLDMCRGNRHKLFTDQLCVFTSQTLTISCWKTRRICGAGIEVRIVFTLVLRLNELAMQYCIFEAFD